MRTAAYALSLAVACLLGGCSSVSSLTEPANIPVFVLSYENASARDVLREVPCVLNLVNCAQDATQVGVKFSGAREPGPTFPIRDIVRGEFAAVIVQNLRKVDLFEQARVELKVESRKVLLERDGDDLACDVTLAVMLLNPRHTDKPYFSKTYNRKTIGSVTEEGIVPTCVYEAVQQIADAFIREVSADASLLAYLSKLSD